MSAVEALLMRTCSTSRAPFTEAGRCARQAASVIKRHSLLAGSTHATMMTCHCAARGAVRAARQPDVVLTREAGKNGEMARRLRDRAVQVLEMPLVETGEGPDREALVHILRDRRFDWVIITSPESAAVFIAGWQAAGRPKVNLAAVGSGTGRVLEAEGSATLRPQFVPSQADAVHLSAELPLQQRGSHQVLYPASEQAGADLQDGLAARGVEVVRLNTYTTRKVTSISTETLQLARQARVLAIASPSAVKAWVQIAGPDGCPAVACIGSTSAKAAKQLGIARVYAPARPGLEGFLDSIMQALDAGPAASIA